MSKDPVFITGGTGYLGKPLIDALLAKGYRVHALVPAYSPGGSRGEDDETSCSLGTAAERNL